MPSFVDWLSNTNMLDVERTVDEYWPKSNPVVFSSARAGLTAVLEHLKLKRPDLVWCPAYSSHCVLEAIAHIATPTVLHDASIKAALIYHQWGFVHQHNWGASIPIIEDAVDTLFVPGCSLFAAQGRFCLWSLPKVIGTLCGGVVFCQTEGDAIALRRLRDERGRSLFQFALRALQKKSSFAAKYWNGAEAMQGGIPCVALSQIDRAIKNIPQLVDERLAVLKNTLPELAKSVQSNGRLPSNLPLKITSEVASKWGAGKRYEAGYRNFNVNLSAASSNWQPSAPLPLHLEMSDVELTNLEFNLITNGNTNEFSFI
jgi:putative PLP-dependent aminotransferase (TIGR04422 family)